MVLYLCRSSHGYHTRCPAEDREEASQEVHSPSERPIWQAQAQLAQAQGYRQQGSQALQGNVQDAQHRLRFRQEHQAHAPQRIQEGPRSQPQGKN